MHAHRVEEPMNRIALPLAIAALALAGPAAAIDVSTALENWTLTESGQNGNTGDDSATGIAIDSEGRYVLVGVFDGAIDHGTDGFVYAYDNLGTAQWTRSLDGGAIDGIYKLTSDDAYWDVEVDSADQVCLAGSLSGGTLYGLTTVTTPSTTTTTTTTTTTSTGGTTSTGTPPTGTGSTTGSTGTTTGSTGTTTGSTGTTTGSTGTTTGSTSTTFDPRDWVTGFYVSRLSEINGATLWTDEYQDSTASDVQAAIAVTVNDDDEQLTTGFSYRAAFISGQWVTFGHAPATGSRLFGPYFHNDGDDWANPDQAYDIAVDSAGDFYVAGVVGYAGSTGPDDANRDIYVIKYAGSSVYPSSSTGSTVVGCDPCKGDVIWSDLWGGFQLLDDTATGIAVDSNDEVVVSGYTNTGTDNGAGADRDWLLIKYDSGGAAGYGNRLWELTWESAAYADEAAWDVHFDDDDNVVVGGDWIEAGESAWRVAVHDGTDGVMLSELGWPSTGGPSRIRAIDVRDGQVAIAGEVHNGSDLDAQLLILDSDDDGDGVGNAVDGCPQDSDKTEPGVCGCGIPDVDGDGDGYEDCPGVDDCPDNYYKIEEGVCGCDYPDFDTDLDGFLDCEENCPEDVDKQDPGECGCGNPDNDTDNDGVLGCDDACSNTPEGTKVDDNGCPETDNGPTDTGDDANSGGGCGCDSAPAPGGAFLIGLVALATMRRRRD
jgi:MYXO-CTERM domain-containing protein